MGTNSRGFTVIEVMIFLAISGMLLIGALMASARLFANTRFQDGMLNFESQLQRQYEQAWSGVNPRLNGGCNNSTVTGGSDTPGTTDCLLLGKVVVFEPNSSNTYVFKVVGTEPALPPSSSLPLSQILASYDPQSVPSSQELYDVPWGIYFQAGRRSDNAPVNAIAFLRSPVSSQMVIYHFATPALSGAPIVLDSVVSGAGSTGAASYCFAGREGFLGQYRSAINVSQTQGSSAIQAQIDLAGATPC